MALHSALDIGGWLHFRQICQHLSKDGRWPLWLYPSKDLSAGLWGTCPSVLIPGRMVSHVHWPTQDWWKFYAWKCDHGEIKEIKEIRLDDIWPKLIKVVQEVSRHETWKCSWYCDTTELICFCPLGWQKSQCSPVCVAGLRAVSANLKSSGQVPRILILTWGKDGQSRAAREH